MFVKKRLEAWGFADGYYNREVRHGWSASYIKGYRRGKRNGEDERGTEEAYSLECSYRGISDMEEKDTLQFVSRFQELRDARMREGVEKS